LFEVKRALFSLALSAAVALPASAEANGRFPESNQLFFAPNDDQFLFLRTTFGFLVSKDRGATWHWVCEQAFPLQNSEDPMVAITPNSNMLATTFSGLSFSTSKACDWRYQKDAPLANPDGMGGDKGRVFIDLAANPTDAKDVVVFSSTYDRQDDAGTLFFSSQLFETKDEGVTFTQLGPDLDSSLLGYTLDLAKSDPQRIYVSASRNASAAMPAAILLVSTDHGQTYTERSIPSEGTERGFYIAAVDPNNADHLYVRMANGTDKPSRLLYSEDAGKTWKVIYTALGPLLGFALSPDGSKLYVGGPKDGIRVASTTDFAFKQTSNIETQCLALASDGLWACSNERTGFIIALSKDEGATFEKKTHFCDIKGALECPAGTSVSTECVSRWPQQSALLGCTNDSDGGTLDGSADGASIPTDGDLVTPGGGCDCRMTPSSPLAAFAAASLAGLALAAIRRRRAKRDSDEPDQTS